MSDDAINIDHLSPEQLRYLVELLWNDRQAVGVMCQAHINKLGGIANLPREAADEVINLVSCFNELSMVGAAAMQMIKEGALGPLN
jgi:hypothetical protein